MYHDIDEIIETANRPKIDKKSNFQDLDEFRAAAYWNKWNKRDLLWKYYFIEKIKNMAYSGLPACEGRSLTDKDNASKKALIKDMQNEYAAAKKLAKDIGFELGEHNFTLNENYVGWEIKFMIPVNKTEIINDKEYCINQVECEKEKRGIIGFVNRIKESLMRKYLFNKAR